MDEDTNRANDAPGGRGEDESKIFVKFGQAMVPGREEIERTLLDLIPAKPDEPFLGVEIGTGTGGFSAAVLREFSKARILGFDGSPEMLRMAGELLGHYTTMRTVPNCADSAWRSPPGRTGCRRCASF